MWELEGSDRSCRIIRIGGGNAFAAPSGHTNEKRHGKKCKESVGVNREIFFYCKTNQMHNISNLFYFKITLYMFRTVSPSIIRSLRLYIYLMLHVHS